jgi:non-ribosomal peptide synthetase component F
MFVLQNATEGEPEFPGLSAKWLEIEPRTARFEMTLSLGAAPSGLEGVLDYDRDLFDPATMARFAASLEVLLRGAVADPDRPISRLPLLTPQERGELLRLGDGGEAEPAPAASASTPSSTARRRSSASSTSWRWRACPGARRSSR